MSPAPTNGSAGGSDSDDDLFGEKRRAAEEAFLLARRLRLLSHAPAPRPPSPSPATNPPPAAPSVRPRKRARRTPPPVYDMFAAAAAPPPPTARAAADGADAAVDEGGYALLRPGDVLDGGKYVVEAAVGQGVFATVYRCRVATSGVAVAVKVSRANAPMRRAAAREASVLREVHTADPHGRACVVRLTTEFVHRSNHSALVFEYLNSSLRSIVRARPSGIRLAALRLYGTQLLRALALLARLGLVHADVKPDNLLVSADRTRVCLADFGCAVRRGQPPDDATAYLAARFYRAPESVLGLPPAPAVDVWAAGCVLFELYTGGVAFPSRDNGDLLAKCIEARGPLPKRVLRQALFRAKHFDERGRLVRTEVDAGSGERSTTTVPRPDGPPKVDPIRARVVAAAAADDERESAPLLADLLERMLALDPAKRISAADALRMPLFQAKTKVRAERKGHTGSAGGGAATVTSNGAV